MSRRLVSVVTVVALLGGGGAAAVYALRRGGPAMPSVAITRGDYVDILEIRGEVRPVRSITVGAPSNAGELLILKIEKNGATVKAGDVLAEFDAVTMRRSIMEKQSELRQVLAELDQARAQAGTALQGHVTTLMKANFDVERAKLAPTDAGIVSAVDIEYARLAIADAEQRLVEARAAEAATKAGQAADFRARDRRIEKVRADLDRLQTSVLALQMISPADGVISILPNYRASGPMMSGPPPEFRPGDRTFAGSPVLEIPDLSSVFLVARIEEADRGALKLGQSAVLRDDAIPDREYQSVVSEVSLLARADFNSGFPPTKQFDLKLALKDSDGRLRPGMSAAARIAVGRIPDVLLVPSQAIFVRDGRRVVFRISGRRVTPVPVDIIRRGREQSAIKGGVAAGDRVALTPPDAPPAGGKP